MIENQLKLFYRESYSVMKNRIIRGLYEKITVFYTIFYRNHGVDEINDSIRKQPFVLNNLESVR